MNECRRSYPWAVIRILRPLHWSKNAFLFAALIFAGRLMDRQAWAAALLGFGGFCLISSGVYILNDIWDRKEDRYHPRKKHRPVASGIVGPAQAGVISVVCLLGGATLCLAVNEGLLYVGLLYLALNVLYTVWLKGHTLVDVMCIALGFVLRAFAGGVVVGVPVSLWLLACTFTLCMFLGFGKRRCEVAQLGADGDAARHRRTLSRYTLPLLDQLLSVSAAICIVTYILYTVDPNTVAKLGTPYLFFSVPLVIYAVFRFAMLVEADKISDPLEAITTDGPFAAMLVLWIVYCILAVTWGPSVEDYLEAHYGLFLQR